MKTNQSKNIILKQIADADLEPSKIQPDHVSSFPIASLGDWVIKYVVWKPGTQYADHESLEDAHLFVMSGSISDGEWTFGPKTVVHFKKGFTHKKYRSESGAEFILIWKGQQSAKYANNELSFNK